MDHRILIAAAVGLVLVAVGGFYFALSKRPHQFVAPPVQTAADRPAAPGQAAQYQPARNQPAQSQAVPGPAPPRPTATAETIEAEIAKSGQPELQALLKQHFADEYKELVEIAVRRRNEGVSDEVFAQELFERFQQIMRSKLKFAAAASMPMIDDLAANEANLFRALGTEGASACLRVLGKDRTPGPTSLPDNIRGLMRLGTLHRFRAIVDGIPKFKPVDPLTPVEIAAFEASLARDGMKFDEVRSGAFLEKEGNEPGRPCLMVEKLYRAIARLADGPRRKIYAGLFFLGRDQ
jgi:hypothetical protein